MPEDPKIEKPAEKFNILINIKKSLVLGIGGYLGAKFLGYIPIDGVQMNFPEYICVLFGVFSGGGGSIVDIWSFKVFMNALKNTIGLKDKDKDEKKDDADNS